MTKNILVNLIFPGCVISMICEKKQTWGWGKCKVSSYRSKICITGPWWKSRKIRHLGTGHDQVSPSFTPTNKSINLYLWTVTAYMKRIYNVNSFIWGCICGGRVVSVASLLNMYKSHLPRKLKVSYRVEKLKKRIRTHYGERIMFQMNCRQGKPHLVYSSAVSLSCTLGATTRILKKIVGN